MLNYLCWPLYGKNYDNDNMIECVKSLMCNVEIDIFRQNSKGEDAIKSAETSLKYGIISEETRNIFAHTILNYINPKIVGKLFTSMYNKLTPTNMKNFVHIIAFLMTKDNTIHEKISNAMIKSVKSQPSEAIKDDYSQKIANCVESTLKQIVIIRDIFMKIKLNKIKFDEEVNKLNGIDKYILIYIKNNNSNIENPIDNMISSLVKNTIQNIIIIIKSKKDIYSAKYISAAIGEIYKKVKRIEIIEKFINELFNIENNDTNTNTLQCISMFIRHSEVKWDNKLIDIFRKILMFGIVNCTSSKMGIYKIDDIMNLINIPIQEKIIIVSESLQKFDITKKITILSILKIEEKHIDEYMKKIVCKNIANN